MNLLTRGLLFTILVVLFALQTTRLKAQLVKNPAPAYINLENKDRAYAALGLRIGGGMSFFQGFGSSLDNNYSVEMGSNVRPIFEIGLVAQIATRTNFVMQLELIGSFRSNFLNDNYSGDNLVKVSRAGGMSNGSFGIFLYGGKKFVLNKSSSLVLGVGPFCSFSFRTDGLADYLFSGWDDDYDYDYDYGSYALRSDSYYTESGSIRSKTTEWGVGAMMNYETRDFQISLNYDHSLTKMFSKMNTIKTRALRVGFTLMFFP